MSAGKWASFAVVISCAAVAGSHMLRAQISADSSHGAAPPRSHVAFAHALPQLDGRHLEVKVVEVTYEPGGSSKPHSHPCPVVGYVIEGAVRMQVQGEPESSYKAGESFYEAPNGVHLVSANASQKERAKFLAYFVCDHDTPATVLSLPAKDARGK